MINRLGAVLLISKNPESLKDFYVNALDLPLEDEVHDGVPLHYGCDIGAVHFAIHPAEGWPGTATDDSQSPVLALMTENIDGIVEKLANYDIHVLPADHGFADVIAFRDPDGNHIEILQEKAS